MRRFKKGDKVISLQTHFYITKGNIYTVEGIGKVNGDYLITIKDSNNIEREYYEYRFDKYLNKKNHLPAWF